MPVQGVRMRSREEADDADFVTWMAARQTALMRTAYLLTGDRHRAEDLLQTTLTKLYLAWDRIRDRQHVDAYARRALINEHRSTWRSSARRPEVLAAAPPETPAPPPPDGLDDVVWDFVRGLPPRQRAVVVLRYYEDLSEADIADVLGISTGTVKSQASRALATLRDRLGHDQDEEAGR